MDGHSPQTDSDAHNAWIAYELHDGLLQWVIAAHLQAQSLLGTLAQQSLDPQQQALCELNHSLELAIQEGRQLIAFIEGRRNAESWSLQDAMIDFVESVRTTWEAHEQEMFCIPAIPAWPRLESHVWWHLQRIAEQAARNAMAHAGPTEIKIHFTWASPSELKLVVSDHGRGFETQAAPVPGHVGLASMQQRAKAIGARLKISSSPGEGTIVNVILPAPSMGTQVEPESD